MMIIFSKKYQIPKNTKNNFPKKFFFFTKKYKEIN